MKVYIRFVWQDMWIGAYYKKTSFQSMLEHYEVRKLYVCLIPMLPIIFVWDKDITKSAARNLLP